MLKRAIVGFHGTVTYLHDFKLLKLYSTSVASSNYGFTNPPMVDYLVKSVGFSEEEAASIATKVSRLSKSSPKPQLVVDFFRTNGFADSHIRKVLNCVPKLLVCKFEETLEPKIMVFQKLGLSGPNLGLLVSQYPYMLGRSLKFHIIPTLELLKSLVGSNEQLVSLLLKTKSQRLLSSFLLKNLPHNLELLQSYGVPMDKIKQLILKKPILLIQRTRWLEEKTKSVEEKLGIPPTSGMFVHGLVALCRTSKDRLQSNFQIFQSYGWSETEIWTLFRNLPNVLSLSEKMLKVKLKYFMEGLGFGAEYLATHPALLCLSMTKRITPRTAVIQALTEKKLLQFSEGYYSLMSKSECKFVKRYLLPFKDEVPQIYEHYVQQTSTKSSGGSLSKI